MSQLADDLKKIYRITELETENAELRIYGAHDWLEWYRSYNHCMCDACKNVVIHDACCAVHNEPAYTNGKCDCESGSNAKVGADGTAIQEDWMK